MITFIYKAEKNSKPFIEVTGVAKHSQTMIRLDEVSNDAILKACQDWMDAFGLNDTEYRVMIQLH